MEQLEAVEDDNTSKRLKSSALSRLLWVVNNRVSTGTGQWWQWHPQPMPVMSAQIKFQTSPVFMGIKDEDVVQRMNRYESIGRYNR